MPQFAPLAALSLLLLLSGRHEGSLKPPPLPGRPHSGVCGAGPGSVLFIITVIIVINGVPTVKSLSLVLCCRQPSQVVMESVQPL